MTPEDFASLSSAERRWLSTMLTRRRNGGAMIMGSYVEAIVGEALPGSVEPDLGAEPWDLTWGEVKVEVKASRKGVWNVSARRRRGEPGVVKRRADVYVLVDHDGDASPDGWSFWVLPTAALDKRDRKSIRIRAVETLAGPAIHVEQLAAAVRQAHRSQAG